MSDKELSYAFALRVRQWVISELQRRHVTAASGVENLYRYCAAWHENRSVSHTSIDIGTSHRVYVSGDVNHKTREDFLRVGLYSVGVGHIADLVAEQRFSTKVSDFISTLESM